MSQVPPVESPSPSDVQAQTTPTTTLNLSPTTPLFNALTTASPETQPAALPATCHSFDFVKCSERDFIGQSSGPAFTISTIYASTVAEFTTELWDVVNTRVVREVLVSTASGVTSACFSEQRLPTIDDMHRFVIFKDLGGKKQDYLEDLTEEKLAAMSTKRYELWVHRYGNAICNRKVFDIVKSSLLTPLSCDRSGAASNAAVRELADLLKQKHRAVYQAADIHWLSWSAYILSKSPALHDDLIDQAPPSQVIRFFQMAHENSNFSRERMHTSNRLAIGENERTIAMIEELEGSVKCMKRSIDGVLTLWQDLEQRLKAQKMQCNAARNVLDNFAESWQPQASALSTALLTEIENVDDVEHAE